jgi:tetratricopeptide (TPR) repeat protein
MGEFVDGSLEEDLRNAFKWWREPLIKAEGLNRQKKHKKAEKVLRGLAKKINWDEETAGYFLGTRMNAADIYVELGKSLEGRSKFEDAIKMYQESLGKNQFEDTTLERNSYEGLARCYARLGRQAEAEEQVMNVAKLLNVELTDPSKQLEYLLEIADGKRDETSTPDPS